MKNILFVIGIIFLVVLLIAGFICEIKHLSEIILAITAITVLWYTWETFQIRISNQELLYKSKRPVVGFEIRTTNDQPRSTFFKIMNQSDYQISVLVKCSFKINGTEIKNPWDAYNGEEYWNLPYKAFNQGHFNWLKLYSGTEVFSKERITQLESLSFEDLKKKIATDIILKYNFDDSKIPKLSMDVELYSINEYGLAMYYPPVHFDFDLHRIKWIISLTSKNPSWIENSKPNWVQKGKVK